MSEQPYERTQGPIHEWFELSYSSYQVLPRVLMQSMPLDWQHRMVACLEEMREAFRHVEQAPGYKVEPVDWQYPEDLGTRQREVLGIFYDKDSQEYVDSIGRVVEGCSVPVPARESLPHYRHNYVAPAEVAS